MSSTDDILIGCHVCRDGAAPGRRQRHQQQQSKRQGKECRLVLLIFVTGHVI